MAAVSQKAGVCKQGFMAHMFKTLDCGKNWILKIDLKKHDQ